MWWADIEVPNDSVDKNSQEASACYPQRTFYLLSDSLSTQSYRVTIAETLSLPAKRIRYAVKQTFTIMLYKQRYPFWVYLLHTPDTLLEATAPVKLSPIHGFPPLKGLDKSHTAFRVVLHISVNFPASAKKTKLTTYSTQKAVWDDVLSQ